MHPCHQKMTSNEMYFFCLFYVNKEITLRDGGALKA